MRQRPTNAAQLRASSLGLGLVLFSSFAAAQEQAGDEAQAAETQEQTEEEQASSADEGSPTEADSEETSSDSEAAVSSEKEPQPEPVTALSLKELGEKSAKANAETRAQQEKERAEAEPEPGPEEQETPEEDLGPDVNYRAGYIPGYKRGASLGLDPGVPRVTTPPGGMTIPYHAPSEDEEWAFKFTGYASASLRLSTGSRDDPADDQSKSTVHQPPRIPGFYGSFNGTNVTPGGWTDLHFQYGNKTVEAHVTLTSWKPALAAAYPDIRSQNWFDQAYLLYRLPVTADLGIEWTVGAFRNQYGGLGQYGAGQYNTIIIGQTRGVGSNISFKYQPNPDISLYLEQGIMGDLGKGPRNAGPSPIDPALFPSSPTSFTNHIHLGAQLHGEVPWVLGLHYLSNWSQDERDQIDNPNTYWLDEGIRPDGRMTVFGADLRMINNHLGNFAIAVAHNNSRDAALLNGMGFFGTVSGYEFTKRYLGQVGSGNGSMWAGGLEYNFSLSKFLHYPDQYWGEGADLVASVFTNAAAVKSEDPTTDGQKMVKFGSEVTYKFASWVGLSARYDHVVPNSKDSEETFDVISPKLLFKSNWITHEQVTLSYTRWFYGDRTHAEFPFELPRDELDNQMFALHFGMWW